MEAELTIQDISKAEKEEACEPDNGSPVARDPVRQGNPAQALELIRSWLEEDDGGEQQKTFEALTAGIDETRKELGQRLLFPKELQGVSW